MKEEEQREAALKAEGIRLAWNRAVEQPFNHGRDRSELLEVVLSVTGASYEEICRVLWPTERKN